MKRKICLILSILLVCLLAVPALAAQDAPQITLQPQSPSYGKYAVALYTVKATGKNLSCSWYLEYEGKTYNLSDNQNGVEPWEAYAGENYGGSQPDSNTFCWFFGGIESELNGSQIWCVIEDGHYDVTSQRAMVTVGDYSDPPENLQVPAQVTVNQGEKAEIRCIATAPGNTQLSYIWYETATGKLQDIQAVNRGTETSDFLVCDTSQLGTRYYVCMVQTSQGGTAYTSVIPVTVEAGAAQEDIQILTEKLPQATAGQAYSAQLSCNDPKATFNVYYNPGKANDFEKTGLQLSQDGKLTGTPKTAGSFEFCICAAGATGEDYMVYKLEVAAEPAPTQQTEPATEPSASTGQTEPATEQTEPSKPTEATQPPIPTIGTTEPQNRTGLPWWAVLLIALAAAGAGVGVAVLLIKTKKS